jgi:hypothetical protein
MRRTHQQYERNSYKKSPQLLIARQKQTSETPMGAPVRRECLVTGRVMKTGIQTSGYQALRRHRFSSPNQIYLITFTTNKRRPVFFENDHAARAFCVALNDTRLWHEATLMCWVLMYDHVFVFGELSEAGRFFVGISFMVPVNVLHSRLTPLPRAN